MNPTKRDAIPPTGDQLSLFQHGLLSKPIAGTTPTSPLFSGKQAIIALYLSSSFRSQSRLSTLGAGAQRWFNSPQFGIICFLRPTTAIFPKLPLQRRKKRSHKKILRFYVALRSSPTTPTVPSRQPTLSSNPWAPAPGDIFSVRQPFTSTMRASLMRQSLLWWQNTAQIWRNIPSTSHFCLDQSSKMLHTC